MFQTERVEQDERRFVRRNVSSNMDSILQPFLTNRHLKQDKYDRFVTEQ